MITISSSNYLLPLNVPEAIMIEPTETEDRDMLDNFVEKVSLLIEQARKNADVLHNAPKTTPVSRLMKRKARYALELLIKFIYICNLFV